MIPIHRYWATWKFLCQCEVRANLEMLGKLKTAVQSYQEILKVVAKEFKLSKAIPTTENEFTFADEQLGDNDLMTDGP